MFLFYYKVVFSIQIVMFYNTIFSLSCFIIFCVDINLELSIEKKAENLFNLLLQQRFYLNKTIFLLQVFYFLPNHNISESM